MNLTFVKKVNLDMLNAELLKAGLSSKLSSVTQAGNILTVSTIGNLSPIDSKALYQVVVNHIIPNPYEVAVQGKIQAAILFGQKFMIEVATENVMSRFTTEQIMRMLIKYGHIQAMMVSGSLYTALQAIEAVQPDDLISLERKNRYIKKIKEYLGL